MQRVKIIIEYDGSDYAGWQLQKKQVTIQEEIEKALLVIFKEDIRIAGAGRTDAGVHARGQAAHFDIPDFDLFKLKRSLNGLLANQIVIKDIISVPHDFHARFSALYRRYRYYISRETVAINRNYVWYVNYSLNIRLMQIAAEMIRETEDFQAFCKIKSEVNHYLCDIMESRWFFIDDLLVYEVKANRFLHGMVRALVGSMVDVGQGKFSLKEFRDIIKSKDRTKLRTTAPAKGLILEEVGY
jgi:tRNA pseudouridine38-40 synthase